MTEANAQHSPANRDIGPLGYPDFRRALVGRTVSAAGTWMQTVASGWLIFDLTHSATALAVLSAVAILASSIPARRATRIEPTAALRYE